MKKILSLIIIGLALSNITNAQRAGCPDPAANNYDSLVTINDGSCTYNNATLKPKTKYNLNSVLNESSGLIWWNKLFWSHDDSGGEPVIYGMNSASNTIQRTVRITNATNVDWEDIAQDKKYIYIGDFGNNANGNRTDLKIYRIAKNDVNASDAVTADIINFSYSDQTDFSATGKNNTNFDCEALIAYNDSLYLFSKDWIDLKTRLYSLPAKPGTFVAKKLSELDVVNGLITGADILTNERVIALSGYSTALTPFMYLLYDFQGNQFFAANKRKVSLGELFTQTEGIAAKTSTTFYTTNEQYSIIGINTPAQLQQLNVASLLNPYYNSGLQAKTVQQKTAVTAATKTKDWAAITVAANSVQVHVQGAIEKNMFIEIYDTKGTLLHIETIRNSNIAVDISSLAKAMYIVQVVNGNKKITKSFLKE